MPTLRASFLPPIRAKDEANPSARRIFHTPGHTRDSISLYSPTLRTLFTADTVLGHGTAIFEDLGAYITSLSTCIARLEADGEGEVTIYPGHGAVVKGGVEKLREYVRHRMEREGQVVEGLRKAEGELTAGRCVSRWDWEGAS